MLENTQSKNQSSIVGRQLLGGMTSNTKSKGVVNDAKVDSNKASDQKGGMPSASKDYNSSSNSKKKDTNDVDSRIKQMQDPRHLMQERLNDMNPLMFGDTIRLPVFN